MLCCGKEHLLQALNDKSVMGSRGAGDLEILQSKPMGHPLVSKCLRGGVNKISVEQKIDSLRLALSTVAFTLLE